MRAADALDQYRRVSPARRSIWVAALLLAGTGAGAFGGVQGPEKCAAAKTKASALAVSAQVRCQAKAASKGTPAATRCLQKAESKLRAAFAKANRDRAQPGEWIQQPSGQWTKR